MKKLSKNWTSSLPCFKSPETASMSSSSSEVNLQRPLYKPEEGDTAHQGQGSKPPSIRGKGPNVMDHAVQADMPIFSGKHRTKEFFDDATPVGVTATKHFPRKGSSTRLPGDKVLFDSPEIFGHALPLQKFRSADEGRVPLENLRRSLKERMDAKSELTAEQRVKEMEFSTLLIDREYLTVTQCHDIEALRLKLKEAADVKKRDEETIKQLQAEVEEQTGEKGGAESVNVTLQEKADKWKSRIAQLKLDHQEELNCIMKDVEVQRKLDNTRAERRREQDEAKVRAECKVKDSAIAGVRELLDSGRS